MRNFSGPWCVPREQGRELGGVKTWEEIWRLTVDSGSRHTKEGSKGCRPVSCLAAWSRLERFMMTASSGIILPSPWPTPCGLGGGADRPVPQEARKQERTGDWCAG